MNIEKELSQANNSAREYLVPRVRMASLRARRVMCWSTKYTSIYSMEDEEGEW